MLAIFLVKGILLSSLTSRRLLIFVNFRRTWFFLLTDALLASDLLPSLRYHRVDKEAKVDGDVYEDDEVE